MALDTTIGGASANSYGTLAAYQAFLASYGRSGVGGADDEVNLLESRRYLDYAYTWRGTKVTSTQALAWPRIVTGYVDGFPVSSTTIPQPIIDAQFEMAYLIQSGATPFVTIENGAILRKREKVDVIEEDTTYSGSSRERHAYPLVDSMVADYVTMKRGVSSGSVPLQRA